MHRPETLLSLMYICAYIEHVRAAGSLRLVESPTNGELSGHQHTARGHAHRMVDSHHQVEHHEDGYYQNSFIGSFAARNSAIHNEPNEQSCGVIPRIMNKILKRRSSLQVKN